MVHVLICVLWVQLVNNMKNIKIYLIIGTIITFISLIWFGLYQYKCNIQLEQLLKEAQYTIQVQQTYIEEKDKSIKEIEKKSRRQKRGKLSQIEEQILLSDLEDES